jgi:uncharacterized coiled-coil protein SlyX
LITNLHALFLESADIVVSGDIATPNKLKAIGSKSNDEFVRINQRIENIYAEQEQFYGAIQEATAREDQKAVDSLRNQMELIYTKVEKLKLKIMLVLIQTPIQHLSSS